ncbi:protein of unknown function [Brochothrix thermosphacta]|nr:protein of unknown function [Brochothrix thermosphacta]
MSLQGQYGTQRQRVPILQAIEYQSFKQLSTIPYVGIFIVLFYLSNYLSVVAFLSILNRGERSTFKNSILSILNKKTAA